MVPVLACTPARLLIFRTFADRILIMAADLAGLDPKEYIVIKGAARHNLKSVSVSIPKNKLVVFTGLSGSGKSSLAFDTLYAAGQRRYVESLSAYARQFLSRLDKPEVDAIYGLTPAIAIEQRVHATNPRSTVGTTTELYDYLKLVYARIGKTFSPISGNEVKKQTVADVVAAVKQMSAGTKLQILAPIYLENRALGAQAQILIQQGYARIQLGGERLRLDAIDPKDSRQPESLFLVVDRLSVRDDADFYNRLSDSVQTAFYEGKGCARVDDVTAQRRIAFFNRFALDGIDFTEPSTALFSFNNPYGACPVCEGYGSVIGIDADLVIPDKGLSVYGGAIACWRGEKMSKWRDRLIETADRFDFPIHRPIYQLSEGERRLLWTGNEHFRGINEFFERLEQKSYKIQNRVMRARYRGKTRCPECAGNRLRVEATYVKIGGKALTELIELPLDALLDFFENLKLSAFDQRVAKRPLIEIERRLQYLLDLGLNYLTPNRMSSTLSGGESQRINLATALGSSLVGSTYILDEPSIGLHPRDTDNLIKILCHLRDLGNTVIVVEHDEDIIRAADYLIDMGPESGDWGGEVVFAGKPEQLRAADTLTAQYITGRKTVSVPQKARVSNAFLKVIGAREHNLKNIDVRFPLHALSVVTGVSGSGKSTLLKRILYPALQKKLGLYGERAGEHKAVEMPVQAIDQIEFIDQNTIGKNLRSNPVTYIKAYDDIRNLLAAQKLAKVRGYRPKHFSFNVDGGRCDTCKGAGEVCVEMQFMADVHLICEACHGKRFKREILDVCFAEKNIYDILELTIDDAIAFFNAHGAAQIAARLQPLQDVGLGYVKLGQSLSTLSGGEAQRVKLAAFLSKGKRGGQTLFIFDEPATGLHFHDVKKLLGSFQALLERGDTLIVIEHNLDIVKAADWLVDLGPEGGRKGGALIYEGTVEGILDSKNSHTARYLKGKYEAALKQAFPMD